MKKRIVFLISLFGLLDASQAGDLAQIQRVLHVGDVVAVHESYCREEKWLRYLFDTIPITGTPIAFNLIRRQWGWDSCSPNDGPRYDGKETLGIYLGFSDEPVFFGKERRRIVKVEFKSTIIFTHLSDVQVETIREERKFKASAATD